MSVTSERVIRIISAVLTIILVSGYKARVIDVNGAFIKDEIEKNNEIHMTVHEEFDELYTNENIWFCIMTPIYGLKQAVLYYYRKAKRSKQANQIKRINTDLYLFFAWRPEGLIMLTIPD